ncbi:hypothetical protein GCM10020256_49910 [Streptomyces thermocoprophilus]
MRGLLRGPRRLLAAGAAAVVLAGAGTWSVAAAGDDPPAVHRTDQVMTMDGEVRLDTSYFTPGTPGRHPAVLLGHGFGGSKDDVRAQAEDLARDGYTVLTWSARGFGRSTGKIGLNDPKAEVADVSRLIDWLARRPEVLLDRQGDPRVGVTGASYGGAIALLAAGHDPRVDAIAPSITYWNLADALFPNGVFKKLWAGYFINSGGGCAKFQPELCRMYERVAESGTPDAAARRLLEQRSPSAVADRIKVPALLLQGQTDSLFPLDQADAAARAISANGAPVAVDWIAGGHDGGDPEGSRVEARVTAWFDRYLKQDRATDTGPAFRVTRTGGVDSTDGAAQLRGASAGAYPGLHQAGRTVPPDRLHPARHQPRRRQPARRLRTARPRRRRRTRPALRARRRRLPRLPRPVRRLPVRAPHPRPAHHRRPHRHRPHHLLPRRRRPLRQVVRRRPRRQPPRAALPARHTPARDRRQGGQGRHDHPARRRPRGAEGPSPAPRPRLHRPRLRLPGRPRDVHRHPRGRPHRAHRARHHHRRGPAAVLGVVAAPDRLRGRARTDPHRPPPHHRTRPPDPALADVPLQITGLGKKYGNSDRYSVRDLSFRVEKGQVLGLLGPNGAGKTTTLRMLMGLIRPDAGEIRVFGHAVRPGAPVLSRVGAFVEGAGFLPHLTGRENLELYWRATGRPAEDAHLDEALEIAGLGDALARAVRTYSQGMRQRLAIAQAMLGLPDLLILDEPTNGLDPPQIREMREVMIRYAAGGRTVIVSSHLLSEVEQSCTHLVVMDRGRLVQTGPVGEIVGTGDTLLVGTATPVEEPVVEKVAALPGVASAQRTDDGLLVRLDPEGTAPRLVAELVRLDVPVTSVGPHRRLEDAFLTLIGGSA